MSEGGAGVRSESAASRPGSDLESEARRITRFVEQDTLTGRSLSGELRLFGSGIDEIVAGLRRLEPRARRSVWNMQPQFTFDPEDPSESLNVASAARGIRLALLITPNDAQRHPILGSAYHPWVHAGPAPLRTIIVDDQLVVISGSRTSDGRPTAWSSTHPGFVGAVCRVWDTALEASVPLTEPGMPPPLTRRQVRVACLLATGSTDEAISRSLFVSTRTVEREVAAIFRVFGVDNRPEAVLVMRGRRINGAVAGDPRGD